jgi:hypothetical protein
MVRSVDDIGRGENGYAHRVVLAGEGHGRVGRSDHQARLRLDLCGVAKKSSGSMGYFNACDRLVLCLT